MIKISSFRFVKPMKQALAGMIALVLLVAGGLFSQVHADPEPAEILGIYFSPPVGTANGMIRHLDAATQSIRVMAYGFTSPEIASALLRAKQRGLRVQLIQDDKSSTNNREAIEMVVDGGVEVRNDSLHAIQHNKVMIIDDSIVVTGSYNFTRSAEKRNAENVIILRSNYAARRYEQNWQEHWAHATPYLASERRLKK